MFGCLGRGNPNGGGAAAINNVPLVLISVASFTSIAAFGSFYFTIAAALPLLLYIMRLVAAAMAKPRATVGSAPEMKKPAVGGAPKTEEEPGAGAQKKREAVQEQDRRQESLPAESQSTPPAEEVDEDVAPEPATPPEPERSRSQSAPGAVPPLARSMPAPAPPAPALPVPPPVTTTEEEVTDSSLMDEEGEADGTIAPLLPLENVQFTAYRPQKVRPQQWCRLLVFAHLDDKPLDAPEEAAHPLVRVAEEAEAILGEDAPQYAPMTKDSRVQIPDQSEITLVPLVPGVSFSPGVRQFKWERDMMVHREEFLFQTTADRVGQTLHGQLSVYLGALIISEIRLSFTVVPADAPVEGPTQGETGNAYRKIFASYSHQDSWVVEQMEALAETMGDRFLRDVVDLRSGDIWQERLYEMIREANVFQLFWSQNAASSQAVAKEWRHALGLGRERFIRPVYWSEPCAPWPRELAHIHFGRLNFAEEPVPAGVDGASKMDFMEMEPKPDSEPIDSDIDDLMPDDSLEVIEEDPFLEAAKPPAPTGFGMAAPSAAGESLTNSLGMELRQIEAMDFWIGVYEVTQSEWSMLMGGNPSKFLASGPNAPVERVSWEEAMQFCRRLTERERAEGNLPEGYEYNLPTETQWEYACAAGAKTAFSFCDHITSKMANVNGSLHQTLEVGSFSPNDWGLHDMHGNVWEWCRDVYQPDPTNPTVDPDDLATACYRPVRGGSWYSAPAFCRTDSRQGFVRGYRHPTIGFRLALVPVAS